MAHNDSCVRTLEYDSPILRLLRPGEELLWVGRPRRGLARTGFINGSNLILSALWLGVATNWGWRLALWAGGEVGFTDPAPPPGVGASAIVLGGAALLAYRVHVGVIRRGMTWYAVTDCRVLFVLSRQSPSVTGIDYADLEDVRLSDLGDGFGSIDFTLREPDPYAANSDVTGGHMSPGLIFEAIPAAGEVYALIEERRRRCTDGGTASTGHAEARGKG